MDNIWYSKELEDVLVKEESDYYHLKEMSSKYGILKSLIFCSRSGEVFDSLNFCYLDSEINKFNYYCNTNNMNFLNYGIELEGLLFKPIDFSVSEDVMRMIAKFNNWCCYVLRNKEFTVIVVYNKMNEIRFNLNLIDRNFLTNQSFSN